MNSNHPAPPSMEIAPEPLPLKRSFSKPSTPVRKASAPDSGNEIWFLTLSDLLLLLVIFFVLLFGLTWHQQNQPKPAAAEPAPEKAWTAPPPEKAGDPSPAAGLEKDLAQSLGSTEEPGVTLDRRGPALVLTFPERIVFDTGEALLKPDAEPILAELGALVRRRPELTAEIHGHTDDRPIRNTRYPSNWELSTDRATQVARALIRKGAAPHQISVKGFGEHQALAPNDSEANRLKNRRVEIHFFRADRNSPDAESERSPNRLEGPGGNVLY